MLKYAVVSPEVEAAGATRYWVGGEPFGPAAALAIARYRTEEGTYLFYLDEAGDAVTDTWHASLEDALHQAAFEYEGLSWVDVAEA